MDPWVEDPQNSRPQRFAMRLSLGVGFFMLASKIVAYWLTGSAAILSDAAESVVHMRRCFVCRLQPVAKP